MKQNIDGKRYEGHKMKGLHKLNYEVGLNKKLPKVLCIYKIKRILKCQWYLESKLLLQKKILWTSFGLRFSVTPHDLFFGGGVGLRDLSTY